MEDKNYGNVYEVGLKEAYSKTAAWRNESYLYEGCKGCHYIDILLWMLGRPVRGSHYGTNLCTPWMEKEGTSNATIEFESGALGYHFGTWGAKGTRLGYAFHAHCEEGMLELALGPGQLIVHTRGEEHVAGKPVARQRQEVLLEAKNAKHTELEMAHFIDCIETGGKPPLPADCVVGALRHDLRMRNEFGSDVAQACGLLPTLVAAEAPQALVRTVATFARQKGLLPLGVLDAATLIPQGGAVSRYLAELRTAATLDAGGRLGSGILADAHCPCGC